jgi:hypothetical protein
MHPEHERIPPRTTMSEGSSAPPAGDSEYDVLRYLAALEARRGAPSDFPQPDKIVDTLSSGAQMQPADDPEAQQHQLAAHAPGTEPNLERLEPGFIAGAQEYARRHGVGYEAWVQAGVDPEVLEKAGIRPDTEG